MGKNIGVFLHDENDVLQVRDSIVELKDDVGNMSCLYDLVKTWKRASGMELMPCFQALCVGFR